MIIDLDERLRRLLTYSVEDQSLFEASIIDFAKKLFNVKRKIWRFITRWDVSPIEVDIHKGTIRILFDKLDFKGLSMSGQTKPVKVHPLLIREIFDNVGRAEKKMLTMADLVRKRIREMDQKLSPGEASRILGVSPKTLWRWWKEGRIKAIRLPSGRLRYPKDEIERILQTRETQRTHPK